MNETLNALNINRNDVLTFTALGDAQRASVYTVTRNGQLVRRSKFIIMGDSDSIRPFWVVDAKAAQKLMDAGYERA